MSYKHVYGSALLGGAMLGGAARSGATHHNYGKSTLLAEASKEVSRRHPAGTLTAEQRRREVAKAIEAIRGPQTAEQKRKAEHAKMLRHARAQEKKAAKAMLRHVRL